MLVKRLIPLKYLFAMIQVLMASFLLVTQSKYPTTSIDKIGFIIGCALVILFTLIQIVFTFIGISIFSARVHFQNLLMNGVASILLVWFALALWDKMYIWFIWGFFCIYPLFNEIGGLISTLCHSKKLVYQKYRSQH